MSIECDVLVVGAGPAGSSAARAAAKKGLKTILIDKKGEIGNPVQCAEGIGEYLFPYMPFKIPKEQLIWKIDGMFFWSDNITVDRKGGFWKGYSVDRRKLDKWISVQAVNSGVELLIASELVEFELDEKNNVKKAIVEKNGKTIELSPKIVIAADGCESTVLKLIGEYNPKKVDNANIYSWEMKNLDLIKPNYEQIFMGDFTPSGYAYIFPKSNTVANVGIGGILPKKKMEDYFNEFLEIDQVKKQVKNAEYVVEKSKKTPWLDITNEWVIGNILLAGDAANQTLKPLGEGILPGIIIGDFVGNLAFKFLKGDNINTNIYRKSLQKLLDPYYTISRNNLEKVHYWFTCKGNERYLLLLSIVSDLFEFERYEELEKMSYTKLRNEVLNEMG